MIKRTDKINSVQDYFFNDHNIVEYPLILILLKNLTYHL